MKDDQIERLTIQVEKLATIVSSFVTAEAVRATRDEHQTKKNDSFELFIKESLPILSKAKDSQDMWEKVKVPLLVALIIAALTLGGFNWGK